MSNAFSGDPGMEHDRDLLPWILGGLFAIFAALAVAVALSHRAPARLAVANTPVPASLTPMPPQTAELPPAPEVAAPNAAAAATPSTPHLPSGQVWECVVNGQHTFAGSPCGPNASIRQLNAVNTMEASPLVRSAPGSAEPSYQPDYYPQYEPVNDQAPVVLVGRAHVYEHRRHDHPSPPHFHPRAAGQFR